LKALVPAKSKKEESGNIISELVQSLNQRRINIKGSSEVQKSGVFRAEYIYNL
jgi:hypothetical protein